jgi:two-component system, chemotaxis family, sensor kinase CheA
LCNPESIYGFNGGVMINDLEFIRVFVDESRELIEEVEPQLISLHKESDRTGEIDKTLVNTVFRLFHSMKGSAASLELNNIASLTHRAETLLDLFRNDKALFESEHIDLFLRALDLTRLLLDYVDQKHNDRILDKERKALEVELDSAIKGSTDGQKKSGSASPSIKVSSFEIEMPAETEKASKKGRGSKKSKVSSEVKPDAAQQPGSSKVPSSLDSDDFENDSSGEHNDIASDQFHPGLVEKFIAEATEMLDATERLFIELEQTNEEPMEVIGEIFRGFHSFKGNCGFLGLVSLEKLSHEAENILETCFNHELIPSPEQVMTF